MIIIIGAVTDLRPWVDYCCGQCYDGAGSVCTLYLNGVSSLIRAEHDKAIGFTAWTIGLICMLLTLAN